MSSNSPQVISISPTSGPTSGGNTITIKGSGFISVRSVLFGKVGSISFKVVNDTEIQAVVPPQHNNAAAIVDVQVDVPSGLSPINPSDLYSYTNAQIPKLIIPLLQDPIQTSPIVPLKQLGPLQYLIGTWTNQPLGKGFNLPYSYNVMPLPQRSPQSPLGYILKNFRYYEELTFSAIHGTAPNRGGQGTQTAYTLFYEQRVYFAEGPATNSLIHAENGSLLFLSENNGLSQPGAQLLGPYGDGDMDGIGSQIVTPVISPQQQHNIAKQVSVPHGNSILALGSYFTPSIPFMVPPVSALPVGVDTKPYTTYDPVMNPHPKYAANPNMVLNDALNVKPPTNVITLKLSSANSTGGVTNIAFEHGAAEVTQYDFTYWLEAFDGVNSDNFTQLQYSQTIMMRIPINGIQHEFPHVTVNTLTKLQN